MRPPTSTAQPQHQDRNASRSPTQLRLASPARTHERNETISRLDSPPLPPIYSVRKTAATQICKSECSRFASSSAQPLKLDGMFMYRVSISINQIKQHGDLCLRIFFAQISGRIFFTYRSLTHILRCLYPHIKIVLTFLSLPFLLLGHNSAPPSRISITKARF